MEKTPIPTCASPELLGSTPAIAELREIIARVAPTRATVLIEGESGTGKELVAQSIHRQSRRAAGPFVAINCAALPDSLVESELFGYERGAFTGADSKRKGAFELAEGGTLFLDEIAELAWGMQAKLLRALQELEIKRIGGQKVIPVDIRVIAATSQDLRKAQFRPELFYRLNVVSLRTPALRHRREDIPILAHHFIEKFAKDVGRPVSGLSSEATAALVDYQWPGNVRQLEGVIHQAIVLGSSPSVQLADIPEEILQGPRGPTNYEEALKAAKREIIGTALAKVGGDYKKAAEILGLYPTSLHKFMRNLGLKR